MTNITLAHREAFDALTSGAHANFALFSCFLDGVPTAAIVTVGTDGPEYQLTPLFVAVTPDMRLTDHEGITPQAG